MAADERDQRDDSTTPEISHPQLGPNSQGDSAERELMAPSGSGSHPIGAAVGAAGGAVAGAALGIVGGPVGMVVGGIAGAVLGAGGGSGYASWIDEASEDTHWRENHAKQPYHSESRSYEDYQPAYRLGYTGRARYGEDWAGAEPQLRADWERERGTSSLHWDDAQHATRAAWERVDLQSRQRGGPGQGNEDI